eukprot:5114743-Prorocentrum_lima.AAC.1
MGGGIVAEDGERVTWDWIPWEPPLRLLSIMGNCDLLRMNGFDKELAELRNQLHMPGVAKGKSIAWVISPPCSGICEFARGNEE